MNNRNNYHNFNDLNISNSSEKEFNDILTDDLLTYSEDKSQSKIIMNPISDNNRIIDNHNQSLKNLISKKENCIVSNTSEKSPNLKNNIKIKNKTKINSLEEKNYIKENKDINNGNNNKDLSSLQISLSNLLSDIDSKDIYLNQNNKTKDFPNNIINKAEKNDNSIRRNYLIDISNENANLSLSNNMTNSNINNNSLCNYSKSINVSINANNNNSNKNNNFFSMGNNYLVNSNTNKMIIKNGLKYNKEQNINLFINSKENQTKEKNNKILEKNKIDENKIDNNKNMKLFSPLKPEYKIEKGENIQLSIISNLNNYYKKNLNDNYNNIISINKAQNFTINNSISDNNNLKEYYDMSKKNNMTSLNLDKYKYKMKNKQNAIIKNKIKLINNKNIDIQKNESKKFFYNPKLNNNSKIINNNIKKENNIFKYHKTESNLIYNNKTELSDTYIDNNKAKKLIIDNNNNKSDRKKNNYIKNTKKVNNISYQIKNPKSSKSYSKNISKNEDLKKYEKKLYYIKRKRKTISSYNSHNNSCTKKIQFNKIRTNTRNIELSELNANNNFSISYNKKNDNNNNLKNNNNYKSKSKSRSKNKLKKNECITEPSKQKKNFFYDTHKYTNIITNDLMNQIKSAQKETTNKLINKLNNMNINNLNMINKGPLFPAFTIATDKNMPNYNTSKKKNMKEKSKSKNKTSNSKNRKMKNKDETKFNKINCFTEDVNNIKQKKIMGKDKSHKKINTQINLVSLLNNFNKKEKSRKNNKSLFNFGNIFFINQNQLVKKDSDTQINGVQEKNEINKEKIIIINDNYYEITKLNTLNYSNLKQRPKIINDFSNYKKKGSNNNISITNINKPKNNDNKNQVIKNNEMICKQKRINADINLNKNNFIIKNKIRDSFKLKKVEGDSGNDIIKGI